MSHDHQSFSPRLSGESAAPPPPPVGHTAGEQAQKDRQQLLDNFATTALACLVGQFASPLYEGVAATISSDAYDIAEAMMEERTRRLVR